MKKIYLILFASFIAISAVIAQPGTLDPSYGTNGILLLDPAGHLVGETDNINDVVALPDGSSYVCGSSKINSVMTGTLYHILADGTQDMSFGTGGMTTMIYGLETYPYHIALQPDGKIVVAGPVYPDYNVNKEEVFAARFNPDGTPDLTFNSTGKFISAYSSWDESCNDMALQPDGKILMAGSTKASNYDDSFLCRINSNGTIDNSFGINGYFQYSVWDRQDYIRGVTVTGNGDIICAGHYATYGIIERGFVMKLNTSGAIVEDFGINGDGVVVPVDSTTNFRTVVVNGNNIYVAGNRFYSGDDFIVTNLDLNGNVNLSFGNQGSTVLNLNNQPLEAGLDIKVQPDNKIVVCGTSGVGAGDMDIVLIRLLTNGTLDPTFGAGGTGYTVQSLGPLWEEAKKFDFQPDGKILTCGLTNQFNNIQGFVARFLNNFTAYYVTFQVDMSTAAGFDPGSEAVFLSGSFPGAVWNEPGSNPGMKMLQVGSTLPYSLTMILPPATYDYKYYRNPGWGGAEWGGTANRSVSISVSTTLHDTWGGSISWANLQYPGTGSISPGDAFDVYAQAYIPNGITAAAGATYGLQAWIGYSTTNTNPNTWTNWIPAPFNIQSGNNDEFKTNLGAAITTPGTYYYASRFRFGNAAYVYGGFNGGFWNGTGNVSGVLAINPLTKTLNVTAFLEGLYSGGGVMNQAIDGNTGLPQFGPGIADKVTIELHNAANYTNIEYTSGLVSIGTGGNVSISTIPSGLSGSYYITIRHRNSIETTSALPVSFASATTSYDFISSASKAYGDNMRLMGLVYTIWGGDVNQDGIVDSGDMNPVENESTAVTMGYVVEDVNGDGIVDSGDMNIVENNSNAVIQVMTP